MNLRIVFVIVATLLTFLGNSNLLADHKPSSRVNGGGGGTYGDGESEDSYWKQWDNHEDLKGYASRPSQNVLDQITVKWDKPTFDGLGNFCKLEGQLFVPANGNNGTKPINWFQGFTIYFSKKPVTKRNWSSGANLKNSKGVTALVSTSGKFTAWIDVRDTKIGASNVQNVQVGIALAKHQSTTENQSSVDWSSRDPVLAATVQFLEFPPAPELRNELMQINEACGWLRDDFDSTRLIKAVNALQKLKKREALDLLKQYCELTNNDRYFFETNSIFWIVRLLFDSKDPTEIRYPPGIYVFFVQHDETNSKIWPHNPMVVVDDIPFMVGRGTAGSGSPERPMSRVKWARKHGKMRAKPLKPTSDPITAAQKLLTAERFQKLKGYTKEEAEFLVWDQAVAMTGGAMKPVKARHYDLPKAKQNWLKKVQRVQTLNLRWDVKQQKFVSNAK